MGTFKPEHIGTFKPEKANWLELKKKIVSEESESKRLR